MAWLRTKARLNKASGNTETYFLIEWRDDRSRARTRALGFCSRKEAERLLKIFVGKRAAGMDVEPAPPLTVSSSEARRTIPTLRDYLSSNYLPVVERDRAKKTHDAAVRAANALSTKLGRLRLDEISYAAVDAYVTHRKGAGRRSRTVILELLCLRRALDHAVRTGELDAVPELPRIQDRDRQQHRFLTAEESVKLLNALHPDREQPAAVTRGSPPEKRDRLSYLAVLMALNTGMRRGEILSRTWADVRFDQGPFGILVVCDRTHASFRVKTRTERAIPLTPDLRDALVLEHGRQGRPPDGWVFPAFADAGVARTNFVTALKRACRRAGLPPIHPHGLRHTWASRLAMAGVDRKTLMELGGWKSGEMLDLVYAHVTSTHVADVMARMGLKGTPTDAQPIEVRTSTAGPGLFDPSDARES